MMILREGVNKSAEGQCRKFVERDLESNSEKF